MKGLLIIFSLFTGLFWMATSANAQCRTNDDYSHRFAQTHLRLGATAHGLGGPTTPRMGVTAGLVHEWHFFRFLQLRGEANVVWQGAEENFWEQPDADYLSVNAPLMLQIRLSRGLYLSGGVGVSYLVHTEGGTMPTERFGIDGVGVLSYRIPYSPVGFEVRYLHRLGSQFNATPDATTGVQPFNPSSAQAAFTIRF